MQYSIFLVLKTGFGILIVQIIRKVQRTQNKEPPEKFVKIQRLCYFLAIFHSNFTSNVLQNVLVEKKRENKAVMERLPSTLFILTKKNPVMTQSIFTTVMKYKCNLQSNSLFCFVNHSKFKISKILTFRLSNTRIIFCGRRENWQIFYFLHNTRLKKDLKVTPLSLGVKPLPSVQRAL